MTTLKHLSTFAFGALAAALALGQIQGSPKRSVPGTDRPTAEIFTHLAFAIPVMHLDVYGGTNSGLTGPWNTAAIGPVLEVRKHLTELQQQSLTANHSDSKERVLVRFEITEAWINTLHASDSIEVPVRTVLYWAKSRPGKYERFGEVRHVVQPLPEGGEMHYKVGASLAEVEIETRDYFVTSPATEKGVFGTDGWKFVREKTISSKVKEVGQYNDAVAFYDTSLTLPFK